MKKPMIIAGIIAVAILILGAVRSSGRPGFETVSYTHLLKSCIRICFNPASCANFRL